MRLSWFILILIIYCKRCQGGYIWADKPPWIQTYYYPGYFTTPMTIYVNGTDTEIQSTKYTPDYRVEENIFIAYLPQRKWRGERERPYRLSPAKKAAHWWRKADQAWQLGCYCCTTYRRYILLGGCAVITTRHILTTATSTELIVRSYGHLKTLEGILGGWYDIDANVFNSSMYFTPSRIHYHPLYRRDYEVNVSHPIPCMYDLSVWAATYRFYGHALSWSGAIVCYRGVSGWFEYSSSIPRVYDLTVVIGFQFMKAYKRRPLPWYKYGVRTKEYVWPCPKPDWHWFHCVQGEYWGRFGFDSGGAMHLMLEGKSKRVDGFVGMCAFSLKLRSYQTVHYFTVVDTWPVLDFLYDAYLGLQKNVWLDNRFEDTKWAAPIPWWGEYIPHTYVFGWEYYNYNLIYYGFFRR